MYYNFSPADREKVLEMLARLEDTHPCRDSDDESDDSNLSDDSALGNDRDVTHYMHDCIRYTSLLKMLE